MHSGRARAPKVPELLEMISPSNSMLSEGVQVILASCAWIMVNCGRPRVLPVGSSAAVMTVGSSCTVRTGSMTAMSIMASFMRQSGKRLMPFWITAVLATMQQMPSTSSTVPSCSIVKCDTVGSRVLSAERK